MGRKSALGLLLAANIVGSLWLMPFERPETGRDGEPQCEWIVPIASQGRWFCPEGATPP